MKNISIIIIAFIVAVLMTGCNKGEGSGSVYVDCDQSSPQALYASGRLKDILIESGYSLTDVNDEAAYKIELSFKTGDLPAESFSVTGKGKNIAITGGDGRGMI